MSTIVVGETEVTARPMQGRPVKLFKLACETYLRRNGWFIDHRNAEGQPFWTHARFGRRVTFATGDAVIETPRALAAIKKPITHVLVTNRPALV